MSVTLDDMAREMIAMVVIIHYYKDDCEKIKKMTSDLEMKMSAHKQAIVAQITDIPTLDDVFAAHPEWVEFFDVANTEDDDIYQIDDMPLATIKLNLHIMNRDLPDNVVDFQSYKNKRGKA